MSRLPGGQMASRPLHFIWICDCSGSMAVDGKIQVLNQAIKDAIPLMRDAASSNPNASVMVRAVRFSNGAQWHVANPTPVDQFNWTDLTANGVTDLGQALKMIAEQLKMPPMPERALPPVLVLISDGQPTDAFSEGLKALMAEPWGKRAVRISIAVGGDADLDVLQQFIGTNIELQPLRANNPDQLVQRIKWVSTAVLSSVSAPPSQPEAGSGTTTGGNVPIPIPQPDPAAGATADDDVW